MEPTRCQHPNCECLTKEESGYCSAYCRNHKDDLTGPCDCGHSDCGSHSVQQHH